MMNFIYFYFKFEFKNRILFINYLKFPFILIKNTSNLMLFYVHFSPPKLLARSETFTPKKMEKNTFEK